MWLLGQEDIQSQYIKLDDILNSPVWRWLIFVKLIISLEAFINCISDSCSQMTAAFFMAAVYDSQVASQALGSVVFHFGGFLRYCDLNMNVFNVPNEIQILLMLDT